MQSRDEGLVCNKAVYLAIGVSCAGYKEVLGLWIEQSEGAKFWLSVMNELKARGVADVLVAVVDGLKGFPDAIEAVFPQNTVQTCTVHLVRRSLAYASYKERRPLAAALKTIYRTPTASAGGRCCPRGCANLAAWTKSSCSLSPTGAGSANTSTCSPPARSESENHGSSVRSPIARADGRYPKLLASLAKTGVLIINDFDLAKLSTENRRVGAT